MDLLKKENKYFALVFYIAFCFSCNSTDKRCDDYVKNNFKKYAEVYRTINDSINIYLDSLVGTFSSIYMQEWQIDSMVCINSQNDKLFATINNSNGIGKYGTSDAATELLGKKINGKWYFFHGGGTLIIPRDMYGKDEMHPLTFHELSQIARKEMLESALVRNRKGEYEVSDKWVDAHFYNNGYYTFGKHKNPGIVGIGEQFKMPRDKQKFDSIHWMLIQRKWKEKIDTNEYKPLRKNKDNPVL